MTTVAQVSKAILQEIVVQDSEAPLQPAEYQDVIFAMNSYMFQLAADGINLGYTEVSNLGDPVTVPAGAINGIVKNVAVQVSIQFGRPVSAALQMAANDGLKVMTKLAVSIPSSPYPGTLPIGSGNECSDYVHFYGDDEDFISTESGNFIAPESNTEV